MIKPIPKGQDGKNINNGAFAKTLLFLNYKGSILSMLIKDDRLIMIVSKADKVLAEKSVVIAKVDSISPGTDALFLLAKDKQKLFMRKTDYLPECNLSREGGTLRVGDNVLVQIKRLPSKNKLSSATCKIKDDNINELIARAKTLTDFYVLKEGQSNILSLIDYLDENDRIICETKELFDMVNTAKSVKGLHNVSVYDDNLVPLNVVFSVEKHLNNVFSSKINLKSGASIYIENTESMCVIDVNGAKSTDKLSALDINLEAAKEIMLQLTLRNISGIIIVDFINMPDKEDRNTLFEALKTMAMEDDFVHIHDFTALGLVEITRKKSGLMLCEQFIEI